LVVEDAALIAVDLETMIDELGAARIVTTGGGDTASPTLSDGALFDLAIVDIRTAAAIAGDMVAELDRLAVPVIFLTTDPDGNGLPLIEGEHATVLKPFTYGDICEAITRLVGPEH